MDGASGVLVPVGLPLHHPPGLIAHALSPNGQTAILGGLDNTFRVWDARSAKPIGPSVRFENGVADIAFVANRSRFITASAASPPAGGPGGMARLWDAPLLATRAPLADLRASVEALTGQTLDSSDRIVPLDDATWHERQRWTFSLRDPPM